MALAALRLPNFVPPVIDAPGEPDVPALIALINTLSAEHSQLFVQPIDPIGGIASLRAHLAMIARTGAEAVLVAREGTDLVGLITGTRGNHPARLGTVDIGIGVRASHRGRSIGFALLMALERWARMAGCHRLQLHVVVGNTPAIALYRKAGFVVEGMLKATAMVDGKPLDELQMGKLLDPAA